MGDDGRSMDGRRIIYILSAHLVSQQPRRANKSATKVGITMVKSKYIEIIFNLTMQSNVDINQKRLAKAIQLDSNRYL